MHITVESALGQLSRDRQVSFRRAPVADGLARYVEEAIGGPAPRDLIEFYASNIDSIGDFQAVAPDWSRHLGWRFVRADATALLHVDAAPLFLDGCGSFFGVDLSADTDIPAVYFFDHEDGFKQPHYAAGSSIGAFMLLLAEHDRAIEERRSPQWVLAVDPDIDHCPRAPAIWRAR